MGILNEGAEETATAQSAGTRGSPGSDERGGGRTTKRPVIGVTTALEPLGSGTHSGEAAAFVTRPYLRHIARAGGLAVLLAPDEEAAGKPDEALDLLDALLLIGGPDVDPAHYGDAPHPKTRIAAPERDLFELSLARRALERDLPTLGICRGMQLMNVAFGGTLHQHLPDVLGHGRHHHREELPGHEGDYDVRLTEGSLAARAAGALAQRATESRHHQGVRRVGSGFEVTGWAADGLPVAIEHPQARFFLGVQWHPEADDESRVIGALVATVRGFRDRAAEQAEIPPEGLSSNPSSGPENSEGGD